MNEAILELTPKRFMYFSDRKWHNWPYNYTSLKKFIDDDESIECFNADANCWITIAFDYVLGKLMYEMKFKCDKESKTLKVFGHEKKEIINNNILELEVTIGENDCENCSNNECYFKRIGETTKLGFEFENLEMFKKDNLIKNSVIKKEDNIMRENNNFFNVNMEFGPNKDENIASTLMGVAVKDGENWRIYDKKKKSITDVGNIQIGNLPIFIMPALELEEGDLIKEEGEYYFVTNFNNGETETLSAKTGEIKRVIPIKNILGFSFYSKVITLNDELDINEELDTETLLLMSSMMSSTGANENQMNQMLPFLMLKDKIGKKDNMMKMLLMSSMMSSTYADENQMNQMLPFLMLKEDIGEKYDIMKMLLVFSMAGSGDISTNPMTTYLLLDTFKGDKSKKIPEENTNISNEDGHMDNESTADEGNCELQDV